jgi:hypothetical protein
MARVPVVWRRRGCSCQGKLGESPGEEGVVVEGEELDARVQRFGGDFGVAETACADRDGELAGWVGSQLARTGNQQPCKGGWERGRAELQEQRNRECIPGMMYVRDRSADSICETWLAFLVMKSSYMCSHLGGTASTPPSADVEELGAVAAGLFGRLAENDMMNESRAGIQGRSTKERWRVVG